MWLNINVCLNKSLYLYFNKWIWNYLLRFCLLCWGWTKAWGWGTPFIRWLVWHHCSFSKNVCCPLNAGVTVNVPSYAVCIFWHAAKTSKVLQYVFCTNTFSVFTSELSLFDKIYCTCACRTLSNPLASHFT